MRANEEEYADIPLIRGRRPIAVAELRGDSPHPELGGRMEFYHTPLGVVIRARLWGLPAEETLELSLEEGGLSVSALRAREGRTECTVVTGKLLPCDLWQGRILLRGGSRLPLAAGELRANGA